MPPLLRQVYWASFANPCSNVFQPFYCHGPKPPRDYAAGTSTYSIDSPWWRANRVKLLSDLNYRALIPAIRGIFDLTERWEFERQNRYEAEVRRLIDSGKDEAAAQLLQQFIDENCARTGKEYRMLNETLPDLLATVGVQYLFTDYLANWTSKKKVPLPIP